MTMRDDMPVAGRSARNALVAHPDVVAAVARRLDSAGVPSPLVDARWLVEHVVEVAGAPTGCGAALLDGLVARRLTREPLQLILGSCAFRLVELECRPGVFVPRPETEIVAGLAIDAARAAAAAPVVVEPCTGTGPILCSLVAEVPGVQVVAGDLDHGAVELARRNLARVVDGDAGVAGAAPGAEGAVVHGALFDGVDPSLRGRVDVVVCNPPYLPASDAGSWQPEVADHDPAAALVGGPDGHEVVIAILRASVEWLTAGGWFICEIDGRAAAVIRAEAAALGFVDVRTHVDLAGAVRAITARRPAGPCASGSYAERRAADAGGGLAAVEDPEER